MIGDNWISHTLCNSSTAWRTNYSLRFLLDCAPPGRVMKRPQRNPTVAKTSTDPPLRHPLARHDRAAKATTITHHHVFFIDDSGGL